VNDLNGMNIFFDIFNSFDKRREEDFISLGLVLENKNKRVFRVAIIFFILGIFAIGSCVIAYRQYFQAEANRLEAERQKKIAGEERYRSNKYYEAMKLLEQELQEETDTFNAFNRKDGFVLIEEETDEKTKYKIILRSVDLMIHPQFEVFIDGDTFKIPTDEEGNGYFSKSKKVENFDQIEGDIVINDWNQNIKRIPFKYEVK